jgi:hypothetical protein
MRKERQTTQNERRTRRKNQRTYNDPAEPTNKNLQLFTGK